MSRSRLAADNPDKERYRDAREAREAADRMAKGLPSVMVWRRHYMDASALVAWAPPYSVERWGKRFRLVHRPIGGERQVVGEHKTLSAAKAAAAAHQQQEQQQTT
jgi:hypothetical protein